MTAAFNATPESGWLTRIEAAEYLGVTKKTLDQWAWRRKGPRYARFGGGHVRYRLGDLEAWAETQLIEATR